MRAKGKAKDHHSYVIVAGVGCGPLKCDLVITGVG